ncbi:MAG: hypothetical protein Q7R96_03335 [Nanoarchaeota archaeon]|nr:hypothetical protein [Nanoarchaeota archaeon]
MATIVHAEPNGLFCFNMNQLAAYRTAKDFAGPSGKVGSMLDVVDAKIVSGSCDPVWTRYVMTTSGEFYGKSKTGIPIAVVAHGLDELLLNEEIMSRQREGRTIFGGPIRLTLNEFRGLEDGKFGPAEVLEVKDILALREYPSSVLGYLDACNESLLRARLGPKSTEFCAKHLAITLEESKNDFIVTNDHNYPYVRDEDVNSGGLLVLGQLMNVHRSGEPSSVSSEIRMSEGSCGRFVAMLDAGPLQVVSDKLEELLGDTLNNWQRLLVPNDRNIPSLYTLKQVDDALFTQYREDDDVMESGCVQFHVDDAQVVPGPAVFMTKVLGYHGFFKYELSDVRNILPAGANAFLMGEPEIRWEDGNPTHQVCPIMFYQVKVDASRRILRTEEIRQNFSLMKQLLAA